MRNHDEPYSLLQDYLGFDRRTLLIFIALVAGVVVLVTCLYVAIFGFGTWKTNMARAGSMMIANFDAPAAGTAQDVVVPGAPRLVPAAAQYLCPSCGAAGLPRWSPNGTPLCPSCGARMTTAGRGGAGAHLAAAP